MKKRTQTKETKAEFKRIGVWLTLDLANRIKRIATLSGVTSCQAASVIIALAMTPKQPKETK